jgi:hypothetical protein
MDLHIQIARRAAVDAGFAFARETNAIALVDAGGNPHRQGLVFLDAAFAMAWVQGSAIMILPLPWQRGQACCTEKKPCCMRTWPWPPQVGQVVGSVPGLAPVPWQCSHSLQHRHADLGFGAARGFFQRDFQVVAQVGAAIDMRSRPPRPPPKTSPKMSEKASKNHGNCRSRRPASHRRIDAGMTVLVVGRALVAVGENFVGLLRFLEFLFRSPCPPDCGQGDASWPAS